MTEPSEPPEPTASGAASGTGSASARACGAGEPSAGGRSGEGWRAAQERLVLDVPPAVADVVRRLRAAGAEVHAVGGVVREALLGRRSTDWDLATSMPPQELARTFPEAREVDLRLGMVRLAGLPVPAPGDDGGSAAAAEIVVTTFREEGGYRDHRHPDEVRFVTDPTRDARRRDFTVNAIYWEPGAGVLHDPCGGLADVRAGVLRAIGDPQTRFREDALRMLRAVRFAASGGFELEPATAAALHARVALLRTLSADRVRQELQTAFTGHGRGRALRLLVDTGAAEHVLPEVVPMAGVPQPPEYHPEGDVLTHVCLVLDAVVAGDPVQAWTAVLHDVGKPATFERAADRIRFSGHDTLSAQMADAALRRLHAAGELRDTVVEVCRDHIRFASILQMTPGKRERWMRSPRFPAHLEFHRADCTGSHGDLSIYQAVRELLRALPPLPPPPLCSGRDVLALGVAPGPMVGEILRQLEERLEAIPRPDRDLALAELRRLVAERVKPEP